MMQSIKNKLSRLSIIIDILNWLSGKKARHNQALREVRDWADTVQKFLSDYNLPDSAGTGTLIENISQANFDLIALSHKGNNLAATANRISQARVSPLLIQVIGEVENTRRALMNPALRVTTLPDVVSRLCVSFEKLREKLVTIDNL
jgi:hypothetical protein